jgi:hypothetical protein
VIGAIGRLRKDPKPPLSAHDELRDRIGLLRSAADQLVHGADTAMMALTKANSFLNEQILPHEHDEEAQLYPALARPFGSPEATATMSRTHAEIQRVAERISMHVAVAKANNGIQTDQIDDLLACLCGLYALLRLNFTQEEENYFNLPGEPTLDDHHRRTGDLGLHRNRPSVNTVREGRPKDRSTQ